MTRWREVGGHEAAGLERELRRELPDGHALHGRLVRAVARGEDCDDVAFRVEDAGLCIVHLTWRIETDPQWPHAVFAEALPEGEADDG